MIVSHRYKFIFLKTKKTAGTAIERALYPLCGPEDIMTGTSRVQKPQNVEIAQLAGNEFFDGNDGRFYNHISARNARWLLGPDVWDSYFKFCVERNPWDKLVSLYYFLYSSEPRPDFSSFLLSTAPMRVKAGGIDLYSIDGEIAVDKVCQYESIESELEEVRLLLGIPEPISLPRAKSGYRPEGQHYRDMYSIDERDRVADLFSTEIALFGYEFQAP